MAIAFHCGSVAGLLIGPFTPPTVQLLGMTGMDYAEYAMKVALPMAILMFAIGVVMAFWAQKKYGPSGQSIMYPAEEAADTEGNEPPTKEAVRGARGFVIAIIPLLIYGVVKRGGMSYALIMILAAAAITGLAAGYGPTKVMDVMMRGASRMAWFYLMFVLFDPFVNFVAETGAFTAVGDLLKPLIDASGSVGFLMIGSLFGIFGISGAAVAQVEIMAGMFGDIATTLGVGMPLYLTMLLVGSQITSFAYPGADMMTELETTLEGMDLGPLLGLWLQSSIIGVTMWALGIVIFVLVYGRMLEIYLLTSLAPIPMATLAHREVGQTGQNYLRSLFAVGFQGMLILVCVAIYAVLVQGIVTSGDPIGAIWGIVGYTVLLCFMLFKTGGIAQRIFGAH